MTKDYEKFKQWKKDSLKGYCFYFHKENDKDVIEHLSKVENKRKYILELIKADMEKEKALNI